jgi:hypothetical protein
MNAHPAYPSPAQLDAEARAEAIANRAWRNNERLATLLRLCRDKITDQCDTGGYSLVPGMDFHDVLDALDTLMPALHDDARNVALDAWAAEQASEA